jgi:phosphate transport system substrate-binding protein
MRHDRGRPGRVASATLPDDMIVWASDPEVADAYPIVTYTWLICYKKYSDPNKLQAMQDLVKFGLTEGQKDAETLGYIPLPAEVVTKATSAIQNLSTQ